MSSYHMFGTGAQNWLAWDVFVDNRYVSEDTWYDGAGAGACPLT
jgi:hypothetical protein